MYTKRPRRLLAFRRHLDERSRPSPRRPCHWACMWRWGRATRGARRRLHDVHGDLHESLRRGAVSRTTCGHTPPAEHQFAIKDLRSGRSPTAFPACIVDGTDACQVYSRVARSCERACRGEGPTLIEAKMMRMKGHAIHDAAQHAPRPLFEYWQKRDPIARFEDRPVRVKKWLTSTERPGADRWRWRHNSRPTAISPKPHPWPAPESCGRRRVL